MLDLLTKFFTGDAGQKRLLLIIIVWLILNAILAMTNHQQLVTNGVMLAQNTVQCPKQPQSTNLPLYYRQSA